MAVEGHGEAAVALPMAAAPCALQGALALAGVKAGEMSEAGAGGMKGHAAAPLAECAEGAAGLALRPPDCLEGVPAVLVGEVAATVDEEPSEPGQGPEDCLRPQLPEKSTKLCSLGAVSTELQGPFPAVWFDESSSVWIHPPLTCFQASLLSFPFSLPFPTALPTGVPERR